MSSGPGGAAWYAIDPAMSRFTVWAFAGGVFSELGHNPTFAVREFEGKVKFDPRVPHGMARATMAGTTVKVKDAEARVRYRDPATEHLRWTI
jgi:hypothetical protein